MTILPAPGLRATFASPTFYNYVGNAQKIHFSCQLKVAEASHDRVFRLNNIYGTELPTMTCVDIMYISQNRTSPNCIVDQEHWVLAVKTIKPYPFTVKPQPFLRLLA